MQIATAAAARAKQLETRADGVTILQPARVYGSAGLLPRAARSAGVASSVVADGIETRVEAAMAAQLDILDGLPRVVHLHEAVWFDVLRPSWHSLVDEARRLLEAHRSSRAQAQPHQQASTAPERAMVEAAEHVMWAHQVSAAAELGFARATPLPDATSADAAWLDPLAQSRELAETDLGGTGSSDGDMLDSLLLRSRPPGPADGAEADGGAVWVSPLARPCGSASQALRALALRAQARAESGGAWQDPSLRPAQRHSSVFGALLAAFPRGAVQRMSGSSRQGGRAEAVAAAISRSVFDLEAAAVSDAQLLTLAHAADVAAGTVAGLSPEAAAQTSDADVAHLVASHLVGQSAPPQPGLRGTVARFVEGCGGQERAAQRLESALVSLMKWCRERRLPMASLHLAGPSTASAAQGGAEVLARVSAILGQAQRSDLAATRDATSAGRTAVSGWLAAPALAGQGLSGDGVTAARVLRDMRGILASWRALRAGNGLLTPADVLRAGASVRSLLRPQGGTSTAPAQPAFGDAEALWVAPSAAALTPAEWEFLSSHVPQSAATAWAGSSEEALAAVAKLAASGDAVSLIIHDDRPQPVLLASAATPASEPAPPADTLPTGTAAWSGGRASSGEAVAGWLSPPLPQQLAPAMALSGPLRLQATPAQPNGTAPSVVSVETAVSGDAVAAASRAVAGILADWYARDEPAQPSSASPADHTIWVHSAASGPAADELARAVAAAAASAVPPGATSALGPPRVISLAPAPSLAADPLAATALALLRAAADPGDATALTHLLASGIYLPGPAGTAPGARRPQETALAALRRASVSLAAHAAATGDSIAPGSQLRHRLGDWLLRGLHDAAAQEAASASAPGAGYAAAVLRQSSRLLDDIAAVREHAARLTLSDAARLAGARVALAAGRAAAYQSLSAHLATADQADAAAATVLAAAQSGTLQATASAAKAKLTGNQKRRMAATGKAKSASKGEAEATPSHPLDGLSAAMLQQVELQAAAAASSAELSARALRAAALRVEREPSALVGSAAGRRGAALLPHCISALSAACDWSRGPWTLHDGSVAPSLATGLAPGPDEPHAAEQAVASGDAAAELLRGAPRHPPSPRIIVTSGRGWAAPAASGWQSPLGVGWGVPSAACVLVGCERGRLRSPRRPSPLPGAALAHMAASSAPGNSPAGIDLLSSTPTALAHLAASPAGFAALERAAFASALSHCAGPRILIHAAAAGAATATSSAHSPSPLLAQPGRGLRRDAFVDELVGAPLPPRQWALPGPADQAADAEPEWPGAAAAEALRAGRPVTLAAAFAPAALGAPAAAPAAAANAAATPLPLQPRGAEAESRLQAPVALSVSRLSKFAACPLSYAMQYRGNVGPDAARAEAEWKSLSGESDAPSLGSDARWQALVHGRAMHAAMEAMALVWLGRVFTAAKAGLDHGVRSQPPLPATDAVGSGMVGTHTPTVLGEAETAVVRAVLEASAVAAQAAVEAAVRAAQAVAVAASSSPALASAVSDAGPAGSALRGKGSAVAVTAAARVAAERETAAFRAALQSLVTSGEAASPPVSDGAAIEASHRLPVLVELPFALPLDHTGALASHATSAAPPAVLRGIVDRVDASPRQWLAGLARAVAAASTLPPSGASRGPKPLSGGWLIPANHANCLDESHVAPAALAEALGRAPAPPSAASATGDALPSMLEQLHLANCVFLGSAASAAGKPGETSPTGPIIVEFKTGRAGGGKSAGDSSTPVTEPQSPPAPAATRTPQTQAYAAAVTALFGAAPAKLLVVSVDGGASREAAAADLREPVAAALGGGADSSVGTTSAPGAPSSPPSRWVVPHAGDAIAAELLAISPLQQTSSDVLQSTLVPFRDDAASWAFPPRPNAHNCSMCLVASVCPYQASRAQPVASLATAGSTPSSPLSVPDARFPAVNRA